MGVTENRRNIYFRHGDNRRESSDDDLGDWEIIPTDSSESPPPPPPSIRCRPPLSPAIRRKEPRCGHKLTLKKGRRSKHRYENERLLFSQGFGSTAEPEDAPDGMDIAQETRSYFTALLNEDNSRLLDIFVEDGDRVNEMVQRDRREDTSKTAYVDDPETAFLGIGSSMRTALKKHLPFGILEGLEITIKKFFVENPRSSYVAANLSSYERLLAHAASSYHHLYSRSFDESGSRILKIENPASTFIPVDPSLSRYLKIRSRQNA